MTKTIFRPQKKKGVRGSEENLAREGDYIKYYERVDVDEFGRELHITGFTTYQTNLNRPRSSSGLIMTGKRGLISTES